MEQDAIKIVADGGQDLTKYLGGGISWQLAATIIVSLFTLMVAVVKFKPELFHWLSILLGGAGMKSAAQEDHKKMPCGSEHCRAVALERKVVVMENNEKHFERYREEVDAKINALFGKLEGMDQKFDAKLTHLNETIHQTVLSIATKK